MKGEDKITINDVARAAGLSKGTVDRVLHNRGEVSRKSREKVLKVIDELGFRPNLYASLLASRKEHKIVCIIPEYNPGEFWELTQRGIDKGRDSASAYGVSVSVEKYDQYDIESFHNACARTLEQQPSGVVLAPMFRNETLRFVSELHRIGIAYVYIDSKLEDDNYLAYFGMPMYRSGYLCADILTRGEQLDSLTVVRVERDKRGLSDPTITRRTGFCDYINEHFPECEIKNVFIDPRSEASRFMTFDKMFDSDAAGTKNIVMFNSRVHLVADYLRANNIRDSRVVGFDVLDKNIAALKDGFVAALIAQHSDQQAAAAINSVIENCILCRPLSRRDNYTQMDILTKYNCDYYL